MLNVTHGFRFQMRNACRTTIPVTRVYTENVYNHINGLNRMIRRCIDPLTVTQELFYR